MRKYLHKLIGTKINMLTLIEEKPQLKYGISRGNFKCDCGEIIELNISSVKIGNTKSCGCFRKEISKNKATTHGLNKHPLYYIWGHIIQRCYDINDKSYYNYGGKGITVCDEWRKDFKQFYDWAILNGWEKGLQVDKDIIPIKLGLKPMQYSPQFCSIVTRKENCNYTSRNNTFYIEGNRYTIPQLSAISKIPSSTLSHRLKQGWCVDDAINIKVGDYIGSNRFVNKQ